jgi:hypothetical protein
MIELLLGLTVGAAVLVTGAAVFVTNQNNLRIEEFRSTSAEVVSAVRAARPDRNYTGLPSDTLRRLGRFPPARFDAGGALRLTNGALVTLAVTPDSVLPAPRRSVATGRASYFDVVISNLTRSDCQALMQTAAQEGWDRIEIGTSVYYNTLSTPTVPADLTAPPNPAVLANATHCRPTGSAVVTVRLTAS